MQLIEDLKLSLSLPQVSAYFRSRNLKTWLSGRGLDQIRM